LLYSVLTQGSYAANIAGIIAKHQITNGGPVILYQPENEYSGSVGVPFPSAEYMQYVEDQARNAGVVVPLISNDGSPYDHNVPGSGEGEVGMYPMRQPCTLEAVGLSNARIKISMGMTATPLVSTAATPILGPLTVSRRTITSCTSK
jgi:hypothetical protein